jgi:hypothetical protein
MADGIEKFDLFVDIPTSVCICSVHHPFTSLSEGTFLCPSSSTGDERAI